MNFHGDLFRAIQKNCPESVRRILQANRKWTCNGDTLKLLLFGVKTCRVEVINILVNHFAFVDFEVENSNLESELHTAIGSGNILLTHLLLRHGARLINQRWSREMLSVHVFCRTRLKTRKEMVQLLVRYKMDIGFRDPSGQSILHQFIDYYVYQEDADAVDIADILLKYCAPLDDLDNDGFSPLHYAIYSENRQLVLYLINRGAKVSRFESQFSPLLAAAQCENEAMMDLLVKHGADINEKNKYGRTALHEACAHLNNERILALLIRKGASINSLTKDSRTPLGLLRPDNDNYDRFGGVIVKEISKLTFESLPVSKSDLKLIETEPRLRVHHENCTRELKRMSRLKFHGPYSFHFVLRMQKNVKRLALLTRNRSFVRMFEKYLRRFNFYKIDLQRIFNEAVRIRDRDVLVDEGLKTIFGNFLPDVVLRNVAGNLTIEDLMVIFR